MISDMHPKEVISRGHGIDRAFKILSVKEIDGFVLAVTGLPRESFPRSNDPRESFPRSNDLMYVILAFPMVEGIGGRSMHQWNSAYILSYYYVNLDAPDYDVHFKGWAEKLANKFVRSWASTITLHPRW